MKMTQTSWKLLGIADIHEERHWWIKGTLVSEPLICFEISFELAEPGCWFPDTHISYFGLWHMRDHRTVAEFQLGHFFKVPLPEEYDAYVKPLLTPLVNYRARYVV